MNLLLKKYPTLRDIILALLFTLIAALILYLAYRTWRSAANFSNQKTTITISLLFDGLGSALCLAGALKLLNRPRQQPTTRWYTYYSLEIPRRLLLIIQIASTALAVYAAYVLLLNQKLPWPK